MRGLEPQHADLRVGGGERLRAAAAQHEQSRTQRIGACGRSGAHTHRGSAAHGPAGARVEYMAVATAARADEAFGLRAGRQRGVREHHARGGYVAMSGHRDPHHGATAKDQPLPARIERRVAQATRREHGCRAIEREALGDATQIQLRAVQSHAARAVVDGDVRPTGMRERGQALALGRHAPLAAHVPGAGQRFDRGIERAGREGGQRQRRVDDRAQRFGQGIASPSGIEPRQRAGRRPVAEQ